MDTEPHEPLFAAEHLPWLLAWIGACGQTVTALQTHRTFGGLDTLALLVALGIPGVAARARHRYARRGVAARRAIYRSPAAR